MRSSNHTSYQGYPYVNPPVHDAPSINATVAASRWTNLPRRQVELPVNRVDPVVFNREPNTQAAAEAHPGQASLPQKADAEPSPVVYIDMPEACGNQVVTRSQESSENVNAVHNRQETKRDPADDPVVYIDLPEDTGSDMTNTHVEDQPAYVQETIFYDPFENRRIEMNKNSLNTERESESEDDISTVSGNSRRYQPSFRPLPPIRPNTLDLYGASSSASSSTPASAAGFPNFMSKEAMMYQGTEDGFPASPIPVSEFPVPPPAYCEIDRVSSPVVEPTSLSPVVDQTREEELPRTQVILPSDHGTPTTPIGNPNPDRKYLNCHHCGLRVHTLVVKANGTITHVIAFVCIFICMLPVIACIYCTDVLKIRNHYCPNCNKIIGYEQPFTTKIIYVN